MNPEKFPSPETESAGPELMAKPEGAGTGAEPLATLLRTIEDGPELPAFRNNIRDLLAIQDNSYDSVQAMSRIILRDLSLTTQILTLVNSIYFQTYRRQVWTVTNAVMLLGLDRLREVALGLRLFEHFRPGKNFSALKRLIILSFFTAILSQTQATGERRYQEEELFITALLFNFGELLAAYYFPDAYQRILQIVAADGLSHSSAAQQVLKVRLEELGLAAMKKCCFPAPLIARLTFLHKSGEADNSPDGQLRHLIKAAHELGRSMLNPHLSRQEWQQRTTRFCQILGLKPEQLDDLLTASLGSLQEFTQMLRIDLRSLKLSAVAIPPELQPELISSSEVPRRDQPVSPESPPSERFRRPKPEETADLEKLRFSQKVISEINQALVARIPINEIMAMIIEGIYRTRDFDRVIFCMLTPDRNSIIARYGLGARVEKLLPVLELPFSPQRNIFAQALAERREYLVNLTEQPALRTQMSDEFWELSQTDTFLVCPIHLDDIPFGVFYVDRCRTQTPITDEDYQSLQIFRDLTIIAIRFSSSQL